LFTELNMDTKVYFEVCTQGSVDNAREGGGISQERGKQTNRLQKSPGCQQNYGLSEADEITHVCSKKVTIPFADHIQSHICSCGSSRCSGLFQAVQPLPPVHVSSRWFLSGPYLCEK
jgi:hypothetical protein